MSYDKALKRQRLIGLAVVGFNYAYSTKKASAPYVGARRDDFLKGICSPRSLGPDPGRIQFNSAALMLHSYQMEMLALTF